MDALLAAGNSIALLKKNHSGGHSKTSGSKGHKDSNSKKLLPDATVVSISGRVRGPSTSASKSSSNRQIKDLKLRAHLNQLADLASTSKALVKDAELLMTGGDTGRIQVEDELERTWRVDQDEIVRSVGVELATQRKEWTLDGGPYRTRYTRNGR